MAKYHINPETGDPGECKAEIKCRFGSPEDHYTSPEAARKAFEERQPLFPSKPSNESPAEVLDRARVMIPGSRLTAEIYSTLPKGSVILEVHHESGDQRYYSKGEDGKTRSLSAAASRLSVPEENLFISGSRGYYVGESPFETDFTSGQLQNAIVDSERAVNAIASELHEDWRRSRNYEPRLKTLEDGSSIDIAGLTYDELPEQWQTENHAAAKAALNTVKLGVANHWSRAQMGDSIHRSWLERNGEWAPEEQKKPYSELSHSEQLKDLTVLEAAAGVIASYPKERNGG